MPDTAKSKALLVALDVTKLTIALATGALVFSADLLKEDVKIPDSAQILLVTSWVLLGFSIVAGVLVCASVPIMIIENKLDIRKNKWFEIPGRIHHIAFMIGVIILGLAMILIVAIKK